MIAGLAALVKSRQGYVPPVRTAADVTGRIVSGAFWAIGGTVCMAGVQFISGVVLARLLRPADFGVIAWADVFAQFILLFAQFGFGISVVQRETLDREELSTAWWSNLAIDSLAALACILFAVASRGAMANPEVPRLIALMATQFVVVSLGSINEALMLRQFMFRRMALNTLAGGLAGLAATLSLVWRFHLGVYGVVLGSIIGSTVLTAMRFWALPWLPSAVFSWRRCKAQIAFGSALLGSTLVGYANGNLDRTGIGAFLDKAQLGYFEYASGIPRQIVVQLGSLLNRVLFPAFASLQRDSSEFRRVLFQYVRMIGLLLFPLLAGLALVADEFILIAYGPQWRPAVVPMRLICIVGLIGLLGNSMTMVCNALGRPQVVFKASVLVCPMNVALTLALIWWGGLAGAAVSRGVMPAATLALVWFWLRNLTGLSLYDLLRAVLPPAAGCLGMAAVVMLAELVTVQPPVHLVAHLAVKVLLGGAAYLTIVALGWRRDVYAILALVGRLTGWQSKALDTHAPAR